MILPSLKSDKDVFNSPFNFFFFFLKKNKKKRGPKKKRSGGGGGDGGIRELMLSANKIEQEV